MDLCSLWFCMLHFFILLTHYKSSHGSEKSFTVTCNVNGQTTGNKVEINH